MNEYKVNLMAVYYDNISMFCVGCVQNSI